MTGSPILLAEGIQAGYGPIQVLWDISFTWAEDAHMLRLTGANGSGRTTLMRVLGGILRPTAGRVLLNGADITDATPQARYAAGMTLVPEGRELFAGLTVEENLKVGLRRGGDWEEVSEEIFAVLPKLRDLLGRRSEALSGGQQQMVAVGRGIASRPRVLLLDEPYAGLAPRIVEDIEHAVNQLTTQGMRVMIVEEQRSVSPDDAALVLARGRIVTPTEVTG